MPAIHLVDALLALAIALGLWAGWRRGFIDGVLDLAVLAAALVLSFASTPPAVAALARLRLSSGVALSLGPWGPPVVFVLLMFAWRALLGALAGRALARLPPPARAHAANRWLGLLPGAVHGGVNAMLLALLLLLLPGADALNAAARASPLAQRLTPSAQWLVARLAPVFAPADRALATAVEPGNGRIDLPFTVADPQPRPDLEARMLQMLNAERRAHDLPPLKADPALADVARAHSADMFRRGYFSHLTPEHADPFDRMRAAHLGYLAAGENIAYAPSLDQAERALMHSPGHRANILRAAFGRAGIGIVDGGLRGLMVTQDFRN
jgi:uncharacterized protein YkwD